MPPSELEVGFFLLRISFWSIAPVTLSILMVLIPTRRAVTKDSYEGKSDASKTNALVFSLILFSMLRRLVRIF